MINLHDRKGLRDTLRLIGRAANGKSTYPLAFCSSYKQKGEKIEG
jgi:hypothetical protein